MNKRQGAATFHGNPLTLVGDEVKVGDKAPDFTVLDNDLNPVSLADFSGKILIMLILGGTGRLYGAFIGVFVYMILEDQLAKQYPQYWELGIGAILVLVVMFARRGLLGVAEDGWKRVRGQR